MSYPTSMPLPGYTLQPDGSYKLTIYVQAPVTIGDPSDYTALQAQVNSIATSVSNIETQRLLDLDRMDEIEGNSIGVSGPTNTSHMVRHTTPTNGGTTYLFFGRLDEPNFDPAVPVTDLSATDHWIWGYAQDLVWHEPSLAHFYLADNQNGQRVRVGNHYWQLATGGSITNAQVMASNTSVPVGTNDGGWLYQGLVND